MYQIRSNKSWKLLLKVQTQVERIYSNSSKLVDENLVFMSYSKKKRKRKKIYTLEEMSYQHTKQNVGVKFLSVYTPSA